MNLNDKALLLFLFLIKHCFELHQHLDIIFLTLWTWNLHNFFKPYFFISHFISTIHGWSSKKNDVHSKVYDVVPTCGSYLQFPCPRYEFNHECIHSHGNCKKKKIVVAWHENNLTTTNANMSQELGYYVKPQSTMWFLKLLFTEW